MIIQNQQPDLSFEENKAILDALIHRRAEPQMAVAMLRRTWFLSVAADGPETREEMRKYTRSLLKAYPAAFQPDMIRDGYEAWEKAGRTDEGTFFAALKGFLAHTRQTPEQAVSVFDNLFALAIFSEEQKATRVLCHLHVKQYPAVKWHETALAHLDLLREEGWQDRDLGIRALLHTRWLMGAYPVESEPLRDVALSAMDEDDYAICNEGCLLLTTMAGEVPEIMTPHVVDQMILKTQRTPMNIGAKTEQMIRLLGILLPKRLDVGTLRVEKLLQDNFLKPDGGDNLISQKALQLMVSSDDDIRESVKRRALKCLRHWEIAGLYMSFSAILALTMVHGAKTDDQDANVLSVLVDVGSRHANQDIQGMARMLLSSMVPEYEGDRRGLMMQAVRIQQLDPGDGHDESARRVLTILTTSQMDEADDVLLQLEWEKLQEIIVKLQSARLSPESQNQALDELREQTQEMILVVAGFPGLVTLPFIKGLHQWQFADTQSLPGLYMRDLYEETLAARPDLARKFLAEKPVCKPRLP